MTNIHGDVNASYQAKIESQLTKDNAKMKHLINKLKQDKGDIRDLESDYDLVRSKVSMSNGGGCHGNGCHVNGRHGYRLIPLIKKHMLKHRYLNTIIN